MIDLRPKGDYLLLVDASSFIHRNFHALPKLTRRADGLQTGALYGFANAMLKMFWLNWSAIGSLPRYGAVIMDPRTKNWRHDLFPDYKAQRKSYDPDLLAQLPHIPHIAAPFRVPCFGVPGFEADDLIATYVDVAASAGIDVVIASSDKDLCALIGRYENDDGETCRVIMYDQMKDKGREDCAEAMIGDDLVWKKFGVWPAQIGDFLAITGDTVDNVPGVKGLGPKAAAKLLEIFNGESLEDIIEAAGWEPQRFPTKRQAELVLADQRNLLLSRELVELRRDVPVPLEIDDLLLPGGSAYDLRAMLLDYDFASLVERVDRPVAPAR